MSTETFSFDDWIASGTVAQRTVELHNDRAIPDQLAVLERRRAIAAKVAEDVEASIEDVPEVASIDAEMGELWDRWEASKETWVFRALSRDEVDEIKRQHPAEPMPKQPGKNSPAAASTVYEQRMQEWADESARIRDEANLHYLSWALVRFETARGTSAAQGAPLRLDGEVNEEFVPAATPDQLAALFARPGRQNDVAPLLNAAVDAVKSDVEVPAPFSRRTSEIDPS